MLLGSTRRPGRATGRGVLVALALSAALAAVAVGVREAPSVRAIAGLDDAASPLPSSVPPARAGVRLPEQWRPFAPDTLTLRPGRDGPSAPVDAVRTRADGELSLPADPGRVGWWSGGALAGAPIGTVVLAGHVDSRRGGLGFLALMSSLQVGDVVSLRGEGRTIDYRVRRSRLVDADGIGSRSGLFAADRPGRLVLITCGGPYDRDRGRYTQNLVVEAVPRAASGAPVS